MTELRRSVRSRGPTPNYKGTKLNEAIAFAKQMNKYKSLSTQQKEKLHKRNERRSARGYTKKKTGNSVLGAPIPWLQVIVNNSSSIIQHNLSVKGHKNNVFNASWMQANSKVPYVKISKKYNTSSPSIPFALYGKISYLLYPNLHNYGSNLKIATGRNIIKNTNLQDLSNDKTVLLHNKLQGPGVSELSVLMRKNPTLVKDLLSYKLIGDRFTANQTQWLNESPNNYLLKPYSKSIASLIETYAWAKHANNSDSAQKAILLMAMEVMGSAFFFQYGVVYTGDRPLCMYCYSKKIPFVLERNTRNNGTTYYFYNGITNLDKNKVKNSIKYDIIDELYSNPAHFDSKLNIIDAIHDFGQQRSLYGKDAFINSLKNIYGQPYLSFINKFTPNGIYNENIIKTVEDKFGEIIRKFSEPIRYGRNLQSNKLLTEINKIRGYPTALIYDAGTQIPYPAYNRLATTTQRITNGFFGALARRKINNFIINNVGTNQDANAIKKYMNTLGTNLYKNTFNNLPPNILNKNENGMRYNYILPPTYNK